MGEQGKRAITELLEHTLRLDPEQRDEFLSKACVN